MSETFSLSARSKRRRPGGRRRWTAADEARYLAAFAKSRQSIKTFCAERGVPTSTFTLWQHQARRGVVPRAARTLRATPSFARVEVVSPATPSGITLVVRTGQGVVAELAGLDRLSVVTLIRTVLARRSR